MSAGRHTFEIEDGVARLYRDEREGGPLAILNGNAEAKTRSRTLRTV